MINNNFNCEHKSTENTSTSSNAFKAQNNNEDPTKIAYINTSTVKSPDFNLFLNFLNAVQSPGDKCSDSSMISNQENLPNSEEKNKNLITPANLKADNQNIIVSLLNNSQNRIPQTNINLPATNFYQSLPQCTLLPTQPIALSLPLPYLQPQIVCFKIDNNQLNLPILRTPNESSNCNSVKNDRLGTTAVKTEKDEISTRPRNFKCTFEGCHKSYLKSSHLKQHIRSHTGIV